MSCLLAVLAPQASADAVEIGSFGGNFSQPFDVSNTGQVVGYAKDGGGMYHAYSWTAAGGTVDLGGTPGGADHARAVNDSGRIVGNRRGSDGKDHAVTWSPSGDVVAMDAGIPNDHGSFAIDINNSGVATGALYHPNGPLRPFVWTEAGGFEDLGTLYGSMYMYPYVISESGRVVGWYYSPVHNHYRAFSWTRAGGLIDIGNLPAENFFVTSGSDAGPPATPRPASPTGRGRGMRPAA